MAGESKSIIRCAIYTRSRRKRCPYQKLYPCRFSGVSEGEIRMGLRPKTQRCLCHMKYGESRMLEGIRVPGRIPFVAVRSGVLRLPAARNDDASHRPATIQLPFPTTVVGQSEESERLLPGTNECEIVRNSRNTIAECDADRVH